MGSGRAEVRATVAGAVPDLVPNGLVAAAPDVGEAHAIRAARRTRIQVHGQPEPVRDPGAEGSREGDAVVERGRPKGHERDDVHRADPWVLAGVRLHVDGFDRDLERRLERGFDGRRIAGKRQHGSIVRRVAGPIQEVRPVDPGNGRREPVDDVRAPPLGVVRDRLDKHARIVTRAGRSGGPIARISSPDAHGP